MLKLDDSNFITEKNDFNEIVIDKNISIFYDGSENKEKELESLKKEKERLESSIERRKKLLSNENYVAKAPENIVNKEREDLKKEEEQLELISKQLS